MFAGFGAGIARGYAAAGGAPPAPPPHHGGGGGGGPGPAPYPGGGGPGPAPPPHHGGGGGGYAPAPYPAPGGGGGPGPGPPPPGFYPVITITAGPLVGGAWPPGLNGPMPPAALTRLQDLLNTPAPDEITEIAQRVALKLGISDSPLFEQDGDIQLSFVDMQYFDQVYGPGDMLARAQTRLTQLYALGDDMRTGESVIKSDLVNLSFQLIVRHHLDPSRAMSIPMKNMWKNQIISLVSIGVMTPLILDHFDFLDWSVDRAYTFLFDDLHIKDFLVK